MTKNRYEAARAALEPSVLLEQLRDMGDIGLTRPGDRDSGRTRMALDDGDRDGRDRLTAWMRELDLDVRVDGIGNIFGLLPGAADLPPLMMGSHIDTVAQAGPLDGVYGVLSGLAVVRAFRKAGVVPPRPLAVAAFTNEEGVRFQPDMLGSLVHVGGLSLDAALNARGIDGARLGYGLTAPDNDLTLADITNNCDVFCIGGTKCGALFGEAAVIINPALKDDFRTIMKQGGAVLAKGRLLGLQFETLFTDGLYYKICRHGVELALQIKAAVQERGLGFVTDSTTNQQFIIFPQAMYDELSKQFALAPWEYMDDGRIAARICTSWATDPTQVDRLCSMIKAL